MSTSAESLPAGGLQVEKVNSGYGDVAVLRDVDMHVDEGEVVAILGANGAGKTTLLRTIAGMIRPSSGRITFDGEDISAMPAHAVVARSLTMVPEGGRLFPFMSVQENLELRAFTPSAGRGLAATLREVVELFPILAERRHQLAGNLSGGERQMCAIARAVMSNPRFLMLDEPSLGLAPVMVERVFELIRSLVARRGLTVLLVEQNAVDALETCGRAYIIEQGRLVKSGEGQELLADPAIQKAYLGL